MDKRFSEAVSVLQDLIRIKSHYFEEDALAAHIQRWLSENGVQAEIRDFHDAMSGIKGKNVVAVIDGGRPGPTVSLNGHMDTVLLCNGWTKDPYGGEIDDGKVYGCGALDMKSGCAAIMVALKHFVAGRADFAGRIVATFVADEEGPFGLGTDAVINDGIMDGAAISIVTEPSSGFTGEGFPCVCLGAKGGYSVYVEFFGESAHAAAPELGVNAAQEAAKFVAAVDTLAAGFKSDDALGKGRVCVVEFKADGGACSVPDHAFVRLFRHVVRGEGKPEVRREMEDLIRATGVKCGWKLYFRPSPSEHVDGYMPYVSDGADPYVAKFLETVRDVTGSAAKVEYFPSIGDYNYIGSRIDAPCIVFGASGKNFHGADEYADADSVAGTAAVLHEYLSAVMA